MIESAYLEVKAHNAAFQLAMASNTVEIISIAKPWQEAHKKALIWEMNCQESHQNAMLELAAHK